MSKKDKKSKSDLTPEELAAKEARKAEKAAAKEAKRAAKEAAKADEASEPKPQKKADGKKANTKKSEGAPRFKHVRKKKLSSGKGPTPQEIGESLVALFNAGKSDEAESTWYHRKIDSIEDDGSVFEGWKGVQEKGKWWKENFTVLSMKAAGPYVCSTGFTVIYTGRVRLPDGTEANAHECGVYTVEDGRIVREQFMKAAF
ncbi:MAG: hypothetical protein RLY21_880 [Planctomycetota bacterium]|jgi:hypothetical protein